MQQPIARLRLLPSIWTRRLAGLALGLAGLGAVMVAAPREAAAQTATANQRPPIAVIDMRRAMLETEEGLRVQATLKKLFDSRQVELDNKQRALQDEKDSLDKEAANPKAQKEVLQKRLEKLQRDFAELQKLMVDYQREMQTKEGEMLNPIHHRVMGIVRRIAATDGFEIILDKPSVPYFRSDLEITDRAIQMYNSGQTEDKPKPAAKPADKPAAPKAQPKKK